METKIDESLYSRQLYAIGFDAMKKMAHSNVLISGMNGLGVEIAKNTILQGFKTVTLHDMGVVSAYDLGTNFYVTEKDIGKNKALASYPKLSELNNYVNVNAISELLTEEIIKQYTIVILVDYDLNEQIKINNFTHEHHIHFISCASIGLTGQIFCDFGSNFTVVDPDGEPIQTTIIENILNDINPLITCIDSKPHGLTSGNFVKFSDIKGMTELNNTHPIEIQYVDKISFKLLHDTTNYGKYLGGGMVTQVKMPIKMDFLKLSDAIENPEFIITDFTDFDRPAKMHSMYKAINMASDKKTFIEKTKEFYKSQDFPEDLINQFYHTKEGKLTPINSIIGGIVAQEIAKACSNKFTPIKQWLYFDSLECLPENYLNLDTHQPINSRYSSQISVFGERFQKKLGDLNYFIVGSGAIGCELLKNFAMIGVGCSEQGKIYITDMDTIERSNLNRQFLFRNKDIGKSKSEVASRAIKEMNPDVNIIHHLNRVGQETEDIYNIDFFNRLDGVANALDNVTARLYMDRRCVTFKKPLLESGTLGTKGNVQVIVPHLTESYGSSSDPQDGGIPICTIKSFPNELSHTVQWSREYFEEYFTIKIKTLQDYLEKPDLVKTLAPGELLTLSDNIKFVINHIPNNFDDCLKLGFKMWHENFVNQIEQLLYKFPADSITSTGSPFWSGSKKCPHSLKFNVNDNTHIDYVTSFANIWGQIFGITKCIDQSYIKEFLTSLPTPQIIIDQNAKISASDEEEKKRLEESVAIDIEKVIQELPNPEKYKDLKLMIQNFEKDDDTNSHIDFITASANLRAINYDINPDTKHVIKGIAGKIIPALSTTTSIIAGLVTLELYKLSQNFNKISQYRNTFINLALPYIGFSEPIAVPKVKINEEYYSMWDTFIIKGDITLQDLLDIFEENYKLSLDTVTYGNFMLYSLLLNSRKLATRCNMTIKNIIEQELNMTIKSSSITLQIYGSFDDDNDDLELPEVLYIF